MIFLPVAFECLLRAQGIVRLIFGLLSEDVCRLQMQNEAFKIHHDLTTRRHKSIETAKFLKQPPPVNGAWAPWPLTEACVLMRNSPVTSASSSAERRTLMAEMQFPKSIPCAHRKLKFNKHSEHTQRTHTVNTHTINTHSEQKERRCSQMYPD